MRSGIFHKIFLFALVLTMVFGFNGDVYLEAVNQSYQNVKVEGRQLLADFDQDGIYTPYFIKGVGYSPYPIGRYPSDWGYSDSNDTRPDNFLDDSAILNRDFTLLKDMNANTIRLWAGEDVENCNGETGRCPVKLTTKTLDLAEQYGIKVIAGFWIGKGGEIKCENGTSVPVVHIDFTDTAVRNDIKGRFAMYVSTFKDHPAILMWAIGNENNLHLVNQPQKDAFYSLVNEMAGLAHQVEGINSHPVALVNGDLGFISEYDAQLTNVDIWGSNVYRGESFGTFFDEYQSISTKPLWISEYGVDAWHANDLTNPENENGYVDEATQSQWAGKLWDEIVRNRSIAVGATIMSYSDNWWQPYEWYCAVNEILNPATGQPYTPDECNSMQNHFAAGPVDTSCPADGQVDWTPPGPDQNFHQEWWGIMAIAPNASNSYGPDEMTPRHVYNVLQNKFLVQTPWQDNANGTLYTDKAWNYTLGYHFTPQTDGQVTGLGGFFNGTKTVKLWNQATGELLSQAQVTASNDWGYSSITPVNVTAGTTYTVAVELAGSGGSYYAGIRTFPQTYGDIKIEGSTYAFGSGRPTNNITNYMFGQTDIQFIPKVQQTPWQDNANGTLYTNFNWYYTMGYHFTPQTDGQITGLGGFFNGTKTVKLWNQSTGELLSQAQVTAANDWGYTNITPINVSAGTTYTVAVELAGSGGSYYRGIRTFPQIYGDIKIEGSTYLSGSGRPTNNYTTAMLGQADVGFIAQ